MKRTLLLLSLLTLVLGTALAQSVKCHIEGYVATDKYGDDVVICENGTDLRVNDRPELHVKAVNGRFSVDLETDGIRMYDAFLYEEYCQQAWHLVTFLTEDGANIHITLKGNISGDVSSDGVEMRKYQQLAQLEDSLFYRKIEAIDNVLENNRTDEYFAPDFLSAVKKIKDLNEDSPQQYVDSIKNVIDYYCNHEEEKFTDKGRGLLQRKKELGDSLINFRFRYYAEHPMIWMLFKMPKCFNYAKMESENPQIHGNSGEMLIHYRQIYDSLYCRLYADHPIHQMIDLAAKAYDLRPGQKYIDYLVRDINGQLVPLSTLTAGKVALIDLWASWCAPCRRHSKAMIPVYEKYKDLGFTIVAIARERNRKDMEKAAIRDGYPWRSLLELNDENSVWKKNGVENGGGAMFLIDRDGTILSTSTDAEELEQQIKMAFKL